MTEPREIKVKLTADTTQYVDAMNRARKATHKLRYNWTHIWAGFAWGFTAAMFISVAIQFLHR